MLGGVKEGVGGKPGGNVRAVRRAAATLMVLVVVVACNGGRGELHAIRESGFTTGSGTSGGASAADAGAGLPDAPLVPERCMALPQPLQVPGHLSTADELSVGLWQDNVLVESGAFDGVAGPWAFQRVDEQRILASNPAGEQALLYWYDTALWGRNEADRLDPPHQVCFIDYAGLQGLEVRDVRDGRVLLCGDGECSVQAMTVRGGILPRTEDTLVTEDRGWRQLFVFAGDDLTLASERELLHRRLPPSENQEAAYEVSLRLLTDELPELARELCERPPAQLFWPDGIGVGPSIVRSFGIDVGGVHFALSPTPDGLSLQESSQPDVQQPDCPTFRETLLLEDAATASLTYSPHLLGMHVLLLTATELRGALYTIYAR